MAEVSRAGSIFAQLWPEDKHVFAMKFETPHPSEDAKGNFEEPRGGEPPKENMLHLEPH